MGKVTLQIVRDGVVRFNAEGPDGLRDRKSAGPIPLLTDAHRAALLEIIERGPTAAISAGTRSEIGRDCRDGFLSLATRPATNWVSQSGIIWAAGSRWWGLRSLNHSIIASEHDAAPPDRRPRHCFRSRHPCDRRRSERAAPACPHFCPCYANADYIPDSSGPTGDTIFPGAEFSGGAAGYSAGAAARCRRARRSALAIAPPTPRGITNMKPIRISP